MTTVKTWPGKPYPLGATWLGNGVNFAIFSEHATEVHLCLFDNLDAPKENVRIPLREQTEQVWHAFLPDARPGQLYGYRAHGPFDPSQGLRFDASKVLLDPYGRGVIAPIGYSRDAAARNGYDNAVTSMKSVVVDPHAYDWEGDVPLHRLSSHTRRMEKPTATGATTIEVGIAALRGQPTIQRSRRCAINR